MEWVNTQTSCFIFSDFKNHIFKSINLGLRVENDTHPFSEEDIAHKGLFMLFTYKYTTEGFDDYIFKNEA